MIIGTSKAGQKKLVTSYEKNVIKNFINYGKQAKYLGFLRAAGSDHFDPKYRDMPFEKRGIFKWTPNAMYIFGIGIPFALATATGSQSMFIVAIYTYISIWLHYFCTEKEDFKIIYGNK